VTQNLQTLFQIVIIKTSFPPLSFLYKIIYVAAIKLAVCALRKVNDVKAIYLRRGIAHGKITYGLSDIDLAVIVNDEKRLEWSQ